MAYVMRDNDGKVLGAKVIKELHIDKRIYSAKVLRAALRNDPNTRLVRCLSMLGLDKNITVIEAGVCDGHLIRKILKYIPSVNIHAFEPNRDCYESLQKDETLSQVSFYNYGLGALDGSGELHITDKFQYSSQLRPNSYYKDVKRAGVLNKYKAGGLNTIDTCSFRIIRGDDFMRQKNISQVDLLSVNTQGTEYYILRGFHSSISGGSVKCIKIEVDLSKRYIDDDIDIADICSYLSKFGYRIFDILLCKDLYPAGLAMLDILFVHRSVDIER